MKIDKSVVVQQEGSLPDVAELVQTNIMDLGKQCERYYVSIREVANGVLQYASLTDFGGAAQILEGMSEQLNLLKDVGLKKGPFTKVIGYFKDTIKQSKKERESKIIQRQSIKTILEKDKAVYDQKRVALEKSVDSIRALQKEAAITAENLDQMVERLTQEQEALKKYQAQPEVQNDSELLAQVEHAIDIRRTLIADNTGIAFSHKASVLELETGLRQREALYVKMGVFGPQYDSLIRTQLASLVNQAPVKAANEQIRKMTEGLRELTVQTARIVREDAVDTAQTLRNPIIDEDTIVRISEELIGMVNDVRVVISEAIVKQDTVVETAKLQTAEIKKKFERMYNNVGQQKQLNGEK